MKSCFFIFITFTIATDLNETEAKNLKSLTKALNGIRNKTGQTVNYVVTNSVDGYNASQIGNTIYIAQDQLDSDAWMKALPHETTHIAQTEVNNTQTQEYKEYSNEILSTLQKDGKYTEEGKQAISSLVSRGYFSQDEVNHIFKTQVKDYTSKDYEVVSELAKELPAIQTEKILGNNNFIKRVSSSNFLISKVMTTLDNLKMKKNLSKEDYQTYNKVYNKYIKALESVGKAWQNGKIIVRKDDVEFSKSKEGLFIKNKSEYAVLCHEVFKKVSLNFKEIDYVFTTNYFYVIKNIDIDNFTPLKRLEITNNKELIEKIKDGINYGAFLESTNANKWIETLRSGKGRNSWNIDRSSEGRTDGRNDVLDGRQQRSDSRANSPKNGGNIGQDRKIKFSINLNGKNVKGNITETKDLVAIHNLTEKQLKGIIELGGFPMPSIAITKTSLQHEGFGEISIVFDKDTIDPSKSANKVFSRDAYSPRFPKVDFTYNENVAKKISNIIDMGFTYFETNFLEDLSAEEAIRKIANNQKMIEYYAKNNSIKVPMPKKARYIDKIFRDERIKKMVVDNDLTSDKLRNDFKLRNEFIELYSNIYDSIVAETYGINRFIKVLKLEMSRMITALTEENITYDFDSIHELNIINDQFDIIKNGSFEDDIYQYKIDLANKVLNDKGYQEYIDELTKKLVSKKYIQNGKEIFTESGNRRSFESLHDPYTLNSIVNIMKQSNIKGGEGGIPTPNMLAAQLAFEFTSIKSIKEAEDMLMSKTSEESNTYKSKLDSMYSEVCKSLYGGSDIDYIIGSQDVLHEIAEEQLFTKQSIKSYLYENYNGLYNTSESTISKIEALFSFIKNSNVTQYFEAKPRRAVPLSEIKFAVVPEDISNEFKQELKHNNIPYETYKTGQPRMNIIKIHQDVLFSLKEKAYTKSSVSNAVDNAVDNMYVESGDVKVSESIKDEAAKMLLKRLKESTNINKTIDEVADCIIDNEKLQTLYKASGDIENKRIVETLKGHLHKLKRLI